MRILLVEDNADTLSVMTRLLRADGHIVHAADGYQSAMDLAKTEPLDLAVCDISLWDGDGADLLKELRKIQPMKAIAVTGFTLEDEVEHYREVGFAAVLAKPLEHAQIAAAILQLTVASPTGA